MIHVTTTLLLTAVELFGRLFRPFPAGAIPFISKLRTWDLERRLSAMHCRLFTLAKSATEPGLPPAITVTTTPGPFRK
jgi:hypothetical protein